MSPLSDDAPGAARQAARRAARAAGTLAVVAYALIVVGALVRAHGAGLSCPDWPLCFGQVLPRLDFRVAFEFGHRVLAGSLGLALCGLAYYVLSSRVLPARFGLRLAGVFALLGVQVVLGGLTVLLGLAPWTVTAHLLTGNAFALSLAWLARDFAEASRAEAVARSPLPASVSRGMAIAATLVVLQLLLGGLVSSHYAGLACPSFPLCDGQTLAPTLRGQVGLQVLHRLNAVALTLAFAGLAWRARTLPTVARLSRLAVTLVLAQIAVGASNVLWQLPVEITGLHSALAALLALTTGLLVREVRRAPLPELARPMARRELARGAP